MSAHTTVFLNKYADAITKACLANGLLPSVGIAQAALESGWGRSGLTIRGNALYGIKATASWKGKRLVCDTFEYYDGDRVDGPDCFRAYDSTLDSINDYVLFLQLKHYARLKTTRDPQTYCTYLKQAGYATAPDYVSKLMGIINGYELTKYDYKAAPAPQQPAPPPQSRAAKTYTVKRGDSWWKIAQQQLGRGARYEELAKYNGMTSKATIYTGQVIKLPD